MIRAILLGAIARPWKRTPIEYLVAAAGLAIAFGSLYSLGTIADDRRIPQQASAVRRTMPLPLQTVITAPSVVSISPITYYVVSNQEQAAVLEGRLTNEAGRQATGDHYILVIDSGERESRLLILKSETALVSIVDPLYRVSVIDLR